MLFDLNGEEDCLSKEKALSIFKLSEDIDVRYTTKIANRKQQFELAIQYIGAGTSFRQVKYIFQLTKDN